MKGGSPKSIKSSPWGRFRRGNASLVLSSHRRKEQSLYIFRIYSFYAPLIWVLFSGSKSAILGYYDLSMVLLLLNPPFATTNRFAVPQPCFQLHEEKMHIYSMNTAFAAFVLHVTCYIRVFHYLVLQTKKERFYIFIYIIYIIYYIYKYIEVLRHLPVT